MDSPCLSHSHGSASPAPPQRRVRFTHTTSAPPTTTTPDPPEPEIQVNCAFLRKPLATCTAARLKDGPRFISLCLECSDPANPPPPPQSLQLDAFYKSVHRLDQRIRLGIGLAYTLLGLGTSVWLPGGWDGDDIVVLASSQPASALFKHACIRAALQRKVASHAWHAEMAIFSLGVVLLQLLFQERLEAQPFWRTCLAADGSETDKTREEAALLWQEAVEAQHGPELARIILWCVALRFTAEADLGKAELVAEVLAHVVEPLEEYMRAWVS
jgi:hypothetical protein